jgi:O-antigen/teichoic acid export membrane protein
MSGPDSRAESLSPDRPVGEEPGWTVAFWRRTAGRLAGDTAWAASVEGLTLMSSLLVMYLITTRLGPAEYGYFVGAQALVATLGMLSYASVTQLLMQAIVRDREEPQQAFSRCLGLLVVATTSTLSLGWLLRPLLFPELPAGVFALLAIAELVGSGVVALAASYLQALDAYRQSVRVRLLLLVLRSLSVLLLAVLGGLSLASVAWAYCLLGLVAGAAVLGHLRLRAGLSLRIARPSVGDARDASSFAAALLSFSVHEDADKILMVRLADPATAGLYAAAYRAVQMAVAPLRALVAASHRRFLQHDPDVPGEHVQRSLHYTAAGTAYGAAAAAGVFLAAPLIPALLGSSYEGSVPMVRALAALVLLRALGAFAFNGLMGLRSHGARLIAVGAAALVAGTLSGVLIPVWSWWGGVAATLVAEVVFLCLCWGALLRHQKRHDSALRARLARGGAEDVVAIDGPVR